MGTRMIFDWGGGADFPAPPNTKVAGSGDVYSWYEFDPVPLPSITTTFNRTPDGSGISKTIDVTLNGTLVEMTGINNPTTGGLPQLYRLDYQMDQMSDALAKPSGFFWIEIDSLPIFSGIPFVQDHVFSQGLWFNKVDYTVKLQFKESIDNNNIQQYQDSWTFTQNEDQTVAISHTAKAVGINTNNQPFTAFENAKDYVLNTLLNQNPIAQSYLLPLTNYKAYKHGRTQTKDVKSSTYQVNENWIAVSGVAYKDDYTVNMDWSIQQESLSVTVNGTITGYDDFLVNIDYYTDTSASGVSYDGFLVASGEAFTRANTVSQKYGISLVDQVRSLSYNSNPKVGTINYTFVYNDKQLPPSGVSKENVTIDDTGGNTMFAEIPIPGRSIGPIYQFFNTRESFTRTVNIDWQLTKNAGINAVSTYLTQAQADVSMNDRFTLYAPSGTIDKHVTQTKNFDPLNRRLSRTVTWKYTRAASDNGFRYTNL